MRNLLKAVVARHAPALCIGLFITGILTAFGGFLIDVSRPGFYMVVGAGLIAAGCALRIG
jgi:hypothetical protein